MGDECEICGRPIPLDDDGKQVNEFFCSERCHAAYIASWE